MSQTTHDPATSGEEIHKAGAFDIRTFIAMLLGIYGVVLVLVGIFGPNTNRDGHTSVNLWTGIALVVVAVVFQVWAKVRPVLVEEEPEEG
ncbi:MAG: hypothetical protein ACXVWU_07280 [Nocardioides sp.]